MKRFRFPLEKLLQHRRLQEERAEQALAQALRDERAAVAAHAGVRRAAADAAAAFRVRLRTPVDGAELAAHVRYAAGLAGRAGALARRAAAASEDARARRAGLLERRRSREVVARLRDQAAARFRSAQERLEQGELDEIAAGRFARRREE
ncbi:MAG: flagellar export protein FliJ [Candidatus Methylomirabilales bacterium]